MIVQKSRSMIGIKELEEHLPNNMYLIWSTPFWYIFNKNECTKKVKTGFLKYKNEMVYRKWLYPFANGTVYAAICPTTASILVYAPRITNFLSTWGEKFKYFLLTEEF